MCQLIKTIIMAIIVVLIVVSSGLISQAAPLILYEDTNYKGVRTEFAVDGQETCVNIRGKLNDISSSVSTRTNECFLLCEHEFCRGHCVRITESISSLDTFGFNDMTSSIRRCPSEVAATTISSSTHNEDLSSVATSTDSNQHLSTPSSLALESHVQEQQLRTNDLISNTLIVPQNRHWKPDDTNIRRTVGESGDPIISISSRITQPSDTTTISISTTIDTN